MTSSSSGSVARPRRAARRERRPRRRRVAWRLTGVGTSAVSRFFASGCPLHAAGIAYRVLFSLAPLAIVLVSVFGLALQDDELRSRVVEKIVGALPVDAAGSADVERAIETIATPTSAAGLVSLLILVWSASGMMSAIRQGLRTAMAVEHRRPVVRAKLVDLALVVSTAVLVLVSVTVGLLAEALGGLVERVAGGLGADGVWAEKLVATGLPFVLWVVTAVLLYRFVATAGLRFVDALVGALVTGSLLALIALASGLVYAKTMEWSVVYGSAATVLVFLYSIYLYASVLLLGATVAVEWSGPRQSRPREARA